MNVASVAAYPRSGNPIVPEYYPPIQVLLPLIPPVHSVPDLMCIDMHDFCRKEMKDLMYIDMQDVYKKEIEYV